MPSLEWWEAGVWESGVWESREFKGVWESSGIWESRELGATKLRPGDAITRPRRDIEDP
jgi:hypothetical protein